MAEITINGVKYTNVPNKKAGTKFAASLTQSNIGASQAVQDYVNSAYFYPLVNAIDINWNGVEVDENSYINTTSDLISYIASKESNIDLSSYATMAYVDQKITDLIGGAPETLDTLKELADALGEEASLAYVTQALDGKADKSSLTNYATNSYVTTELDKKADKSQLPDMNNYSTVSYVTTELDKKANKSEIPSMPDLTPYVSYEQANSYYAPKTEQAFYNLTEAGVGICIAYTKPPQDTNYIASKLNTAAVDTVSSNSLVISDIRQDYNLNLNLTNTIIGGALYKPNGVDSQYVSTYLSDSIAIGSNMTAYWMSSENKYKPVANNLIIGENLVSRNSKQLIVGKWNECTYVWWDKSNPQGQTMFAVGNGAKNARHNAFEVRDNGDIYISDTSNGTPYRLQDRLDMSSYVPMTSYNALVARVEELAGWIVSYHSTPEPPTPSYDFNFDDEYIGMNIGDIVTPSITNTYPDYTNISYTSSDSSVVSVDANGTCTALTLGQATISATLYDNNGGEQAFSSVQLNVNKFVPVAYWSFNGTALPNEKMVVLPYDTLTQSTYTFYSDPATGWFASDTLYETPGITIDNSTYVITVDPTSFEHAGKGRAQIEYNEDATYQHGGCAIEFKILAQGTDPQFFFASDDVNMSQNYTQTEVQLYDLTGLTEQGYTPTLTVSNPSYVSAAPRQDAPNIIQFTWLAEGETTVTATITDGNETHSATITVHCQWDRDWTDGHVYTSQNNEVNYEYGIVKSGSNPSLTFTASNGNTQDPMNGDLFEVSIPNDIYNIVSYTSTSSGLTISFDNNALASASAGDEINMTIIKQQDTTYGYYTKDLRFKVVHAGNDPLLWWNSDTFTVTENDVFSQDPITNWLGNQIIDFSTWQPLTPTLSITNGDGAAHLDQDNVLHGDSVGTSTITATVTDLNNNTHTATATVHVEAAVYSNTSVYYNNDPNQGQGFLDTNPYAIGLSNASMPVEISFEGPEYNTNNASNDFSIVYDTNFSTPKAMDATIIDLHNTYSSGVNHIQFALSLDNVTMSTAGEQNRFILTFGHGGTNYLTDYIKFEFNGADS